MGKLKLNPDFNSEEGNQDNPGQKKVMVDEDLLNDEGDQEGKEPEGDEPEGEGDQSDASTDKEPTDGEGDDAEGDADEDAKKRELEGLKKDEGKIDQDLTDLDIEIKATKERIVEKRRARREARRKASESPGEPEPEKDDLADIDQEDITRMERVLKAKGYVPRSELEGIRFTEAQKDAEEVFFEKNPQYKPANDKDDVLYNALQEEVALFAKPKSPKDILRILSKAHDQVVKKFPSHFTKRDTKADDAAHKAKAKVAGTGTGNSGASHKKASKSGSNLTAEQIQHLRDGGFSDEDIAEM